MIDMKAYEEGQDAYATKGLNNNPHPTSTDSHTSWARGWKSMTKDDPLGHLNVDSDKDQDQADETEDD